jgi:hypothetical protein
MDKMSIMRCLILYVKHGFNGRITLIFIIAQTLILSSLFSQSFKKPIDYRFKGGEGNYISFFSKNITIPGPELKNGIFGNLIIKIAIKPSGEINEITVINPIDSIIDNEVIRVIDLSREFWKRMDSVKYNQNIYIQVGFSIAKYLPNLFNPKSEKFIKLFPKPILIPLESDKQIPFFKSQEISEKANKSLENEKFGEALPLINELIRRDPFNRDLYKTRIMINIRLNRPELVEEDDNKIFNFAEGFSLDELFTGQEK